MLSEGVVDVQICRKADCRELLDTETIGTGIARGFKMVTRRYGRTGRRGGEGYDSMPVIMWLEKQKEVDEPQ